MVGISSGDYIPFELFYGESVRQKQVCWRRHVDGKTGRGILSRRSRHPLITSVLITGPRATNFRPRGTIPPTAPWGSRTQIQK